MWQPFRFRLATLPWLLCLTPSSMGSRYKWRASKYKSKLTPWLCCPLEPVGSGCCYGYHIPRGGTGVFVKGEGVGGGVMGAACDYKPI